MKITSTTLSSVKKNLKRTRKYSAKKEQPEICIPSETVRDLFDEDIIDLTDNISLDELVTEERSQLKMSPAAKQELRADIVRDVLVGIKDLHKDISKSKRTKTKLTKGGESLCVLFSDWHYGKVIKSKSGQFIYNSEIAENRIQTQLIPKILENIERAGSAKKIDEVVLIFAGDIVDNDIVYDTQRHRIDKGVAEQFHGITRLIVQFIHEVAATLDILGLKNTKIRLECVIGNHGRPSSISKMGICSWDTAVYSAIDLAMKQSSIAKRVDISFALEDYKIINVRGHRGLIQHQAPPQSETPSAKKKFSGWYEIFDYDFMCYGDLHHIGFSKYNGKPLIMNGSLCGYDEFAIKLGVRDNWGQLMWMTSDKNPVSMLQEIS